MTDNFAGELNRLMEILDRGEFAGAYEGAVALLEKTSEELKGTDTYHIALFMLAGVLIDIGGTSSIDAATTTGVALLKDNESEMLELISRHTYFYCRSNGEANLLKGRNPFDHTFESVEQMVALKNLFWKAIRYSEEETGASPPQYKVNLANALRDQFRIVEALSLYDGVNGHDADIFESWYNRSEALKRLNQISNSYTIRMLEEVREGYERALNSANLPPVFKEYYRQQFQWHAGIVEKARKELGIPDDEQDHSKTLAEFSRLSAYRKFCLTERMTLSEHALYCACVGSARDDLIISTKSGVVGSFVVPMERVLNRLKSEFTFARSLYYEYLFQPTPKELQQELLFTELFDGEVLGFDIEKVRSGFRTCFGILDKIAASVCELYDLNPKNEHVYFENMWRLNSPGRREMFETVKNPGLLALYSIATDLNMHKGGEWSIYKDWRDDMEHKFVVIYDGNEPPDRNSIYGFTKEVTFIQKDDFILHFARLLQLTRSAIFSFVFSVREKAASLKSPGVIYRDREIRGRKDE